MNSDKVLKLLAQGIEPALVNEMLRRELVRETVRQAPAPQAFATEQATLNLPLVQWPQHEVDPYLTDLRRAFAAYRDKRSQSRQSTGAILRELYAVAQDIPSIRRMREVAAQALAIKGTRVALASLVMRESGGTGDTRVSSVDAWLSGYRAPTMREAQAMAQGISALGLSPRDLAHICSRAQEVIDYYRSAIGLSPSRTVVGRMNNGGKN